MYVTIEEIREGLANLANLTPEELTALRAGIVDLANATDADEAATSKESVALLQELADAGEMVMARQGEIEAEQAQAESDRAAARERIAKISGKAAEGNEGGTETGDEGGDAGAEGGEAGAEGKGAPVPVVASGSRSGSSVARIAASQGSRRGSPEIPTPSVRGGSGQRGALLASGDLVTMRNDEEIQSLDQLASAMAATLERMSPLDRPRGRVLVASASWSNAYSDDRRFGKDAEVNGRMVDAELKPIIATGGICAPVNVDYGMEEWATAERPLRDSFPNYEASRGGLLFRTPPDFGSLLGATTVWSEATDANPGTSKKGIVSIACPSTTTVYVDAVPTRLGFGNMQSRFDPETVAINTSLSLVAAANVAELNLLAKVQSFAVKSVTTAAYLGAARDIFSTVDKAAAIFRNVHRLPDSVVLRVILPRWVKSLIRIDRINELAHDNAGAEDVFGISDQWIEDMFAVRNVKPTWILDNAPAVSSSGSTAGYPLQGWTGFTTDAAIPLFPTSTAWYMYVEGSIQFLDGGRLDLGVVRDSTLDATNDYETFVEPFEGLANRGFANNVIEFISSFCANGHSAASASTTTCN